MKARQVRRTIFITVCFLTVSAASQIKEIKVPDEAKPFVEKGMVVLELRSGDLNGDGRKDIILVLGKPRDEKDKFDKVGDENRPTLLLIRETSGRLSLAIRNDLVAYCRNCGGLFGDPFEWVKLHRLGFEVANMGGDSDRWIDTFWFSYSRQYETWQLTRVEKSAYRASPSAKLRTRVYTPPKSFGLINFADFDPRDFRGKGKK